MSRKFTFFSHCVTGLVTAFIALLIVQRESGNHFQIKELFSINSPVSGPGLCIIVICILLFASAAVGAHSTED